MTTKKTFPAKLIEITLDPDSPSESLINAVIAQSERSGMKKVDVTRALKMDFSQMNKYRHGTEMKLDKMVDISRALEEHHLGKIRVFLEPPNPANEK